MELKVKDALLKGVEAHKAGKLQEADQLYTAILKAQPKHPDANHNMGVLAVGVGKVQEALPFFKTALEANPSKAQYWLSYIDTLIKLNRMADAKAVFDQAKEKGGKGESFNKLEQQLAELMILPRQSNILDTLKLDQAIKLAKEKSKGGSSEEAKRIYQDILAKFSKNRKAIDGIKALSGGPVGKKSRLQDPPQDQLQPLINLYRNGRLQKALDSVSQLLQQFPNSVILYNIQGAANAGLKQFQEANECYKKVIKINPNYTEAYYNMGNALQEQGKLEESIKAYKKALAINPNYTEVYYNMGNALKGQGKLEESIKAYKKALSINPDHAEACNNMGNALHKRGKQEEAIKVYNKALSLNPNYTEAYYNMGNALQEQGKLEESIKAYKKALAINPDHANAYNNMGNTLHKRGKQEEAIKAFKKALAINPDHAEAYNNMGNTLHKQGKLEQAIEAYNKALAINPDYADAYYNLGNALKDQGKLEQAIEAYNKALSINPDYAEAYNNMGDALSNLGDLEEAIESYNKALSIKPDDVDVAWNLSGMAKNIGEAKSWIEYCLKADQSHLKAKLTLSALQFFEGDKSEFNSLMQSSLKDHPYMRSFAWVFDLPELPELYSHRWALFDRMVERSKQARPFYEFGVWRGEAFRHLIKTFKKGYGFDTFEGLPEDWHDEAAGTYSSDGNIPQIEGGEFIVGKFEDTLPEFFSEPRPTASLINFDADLYSSTICALNFSKPVIDRHTILIFDEFIINENWEQDEYKALSEFCLNNNYIYEVLAISFFSKQVAVRLVGI